MENKKSDSYDSLDSCFKRLQVNSSSMKDYLIYSVPLIFESITSQNRSKNLRIPSKFDLMGKQAMDIESYLHRLLKLTHAQIPTLIYALVLIDKLCSTRKFYLTEKNMHKTLLTSLILSIKYLEDNIYEYKQYEYAGGVSIKELSELEFEFLMLVDFNIKIKDEDFYIYLNQCREGIMNQY